MKLHILRGPEAAGFVIFGATLGAALTSVAHAGLLVTWAGGTAGAILVPIALAFPWGRLARGALTGWTSSTI